VKHYFVPWNLKHDNDAKFEVTSHNVEVLVEIRNTVEYFKDRPLVL